MNQKKRILNVAKRMKILIKWELGIDFERWRGRKMEWKMKTKTHERREIRKNKRKK